MRISSSTIYDLNVSSMNQQQYNILQTQTHISSTKRVMTPADDPVAAAQIVTVNQSIATNSQFTTKNNVAAQASLGLADNALQGISSLIQSMQSTAVNAGNGSLTNADRQSLAISLQGQLDQMIALANSTDGAGNYLFSGGQGNVQPFTKTTTGATYNGDDVQRMVQVAASLRMAASDSGADVFMRIKNGNGTFATGIGGTVPMDGMNNLSGATGVAYDFSAVAGNGSVTTGTLTPASLNFTGAGADTLTIDGNPVNLTADYSGAGGLTTMAGDIQTALAGFGAYTVTADTVNNTLTITGPSTAAVSMSIPAAGTLATAGFTNSAGTPGVTAINGNNIIQTNGTLNFAGTGALAQMNIDGIPVTLNQNYANMGALASDIQSQLQVSNPAYLVTASGNALTITGPGTAAVAISNADVNAQAAGFVNLPGNAGATNQNATFSVDGTPVVVNTPVTVAGNGIGPGTLAAAIQAGLTAAGLTTYTVSPDSGSGLRITHTGSPNAVAISAANAVAIQNGIVNSAGTAGATAGTSTNTGTGVISQGVLGSPAPTVDQLGNRYQVSFSVSGGVTTYSITGADASGAILPTANQPGALPTNVAYTSGQTIGFNGIQFDIQGAPANGDTFTVVPSTNVSVFQTVTSLISALNTPVTSGNAAASAALNQQLNTALSGLDQSLTKVLSVRASVGSRLSQLSALQTSGSALNTVYKQNLSSLQDLDMTKAISDLSQQQVSLQAAMQSFQKVSSLSLFNYM
ncbi:MAG: flagellar hook-associated protein 3 [Sideroxydans sp.]|nr:flagellar hook-associated protein 3 [Sideroxydans sp.]